MISYATRQRPLADALHERLAARGCAPKLDHLDIPVGERWRQTIGWWLSACHTAVVLLSESALVSTWVTYELSVLAHRSHVRKDLHLVLVFLGVSRDEVCAQERFEPLDLGEIQSIELPPDDEAVEADEAALAAMEEAVTAPTDEPGASPLDPLVDLVHDLVRATGPARLERAWHALHTGSSAVVADPWLALPPASRRDTDALEYARTYCSTSLAAAYGSLDVLARDPRLAASEIVELVDLNVMAMIDTRLTHELRLAAEDGQVRRSLVVAINQADLAALATRTVHDVAGSRTVYAFVLNGTVNGGGVAEVTDELADELRGEIESVRGEPADAFLAEVGAYRHPVFALLTRADGITAPVLAGLEQRFPTVVFVVLTSATRSMPELAGALGVSGAGPVLEGADWADHVERERDLVTARVTTRQNLLRVKR